MQAAGMATDAMATPRDRGFPWPVLALCVIAGLPFFVTALPQMTDFGSHLARYHVMLDGGRSAWLAKYYDFEWIVAGNLGADLLMVPLGHLLGVERAAWLIGLAIPLLTALGVFCVEWTLRRRVGAGSLLALATIWSPAMVMGFYNFCLSLALALFAFVAWVRLEGRAWRGWCLAPAGLLVWLCHASGWGVLGVLVFGYEWHRRKGPGAFVAPWPLFLPLVAQILTGGAKGVLDYGDNVLRYKRLIWLQALRGQSLLLDIAMLALFVGAIAVAAWLRRIDGRLGWAALLLAALSLGMPRHFGGGDYADYRLVAASLMVGALAIDWPVRRAGLVLAVLPFLARMAVLTASWHATARETGRILGALDHIPRGARVAGAVLIERRWELDPFEHVTSYATVRRDALVNSHFAIPGVHMLRLREGGAAFADPSHRVFHRKGRPVDLSRFAPAARADWLWYVGEVEPARLPPGARVVWRTRGALLARLAKPPATR